ncbi:MAG: hypothetical protein ABGX83_10070 [Nitrospira sp.]|nr:hypothetical protein [Candidatus Manganitrophaceae bacterium]HIL33889.1 hypothetical protein [Candidatus Manganitrophaceae bacterium]
MSKLKGGDRVWRGIIGVILSLSYYVSPEQMMPVSGRGIVIFLIFLFFVILPDLKGLRGGAVAGFLSLAFAGMGHLYVRQYARAFLFSLGGVFSYMISNYSPKSVLFNILIFIISAVDSFSFGKRGFGIF